VACIGQAGENLVRFASTIVDKYASAARGSGAVLGSKNLKAVVVVGNHTVSLADPETFKELARLDREFFATDEFQQSVATKYGSLYGMSNWRPGFRNYAKYLEPGEVPPDLRPEAWKKFETGRTGCGNCSVRCKNVYEIPSGARKGEHGEALEYESIFCMGTNCGVTDPVAIMEMSNLGDIYGLDVIPLGNTLALAKDLFARGILTREMTGGLDLSWDNSADQVELVHSRPCARDSATSWPKACSPWPRSSDPKPCATATTSRASAAVPIRPGSSPWPTPPPRAAPTTCAAAVGPTAKTTPLSIPSFRPPEPCMRT
jgi:aldehyde:ferredoxin oxidoreductase